MEEVLGKQQNVGLEGGLKKSYYYKSISKIMSVIHSKIPVRDYDTKVAASPTNIRE